MQPTLQTHRSKQARRRILRAIPVYWARAGRGLGLSLVLVGAAAWWPQWASAQVIRCTDSATGKVTYTNSECAQGATMREVEARKSPEQIRQERDQAAQALADRRERERMEAQETRDRRAEERAAAPPRPTLSTARDPAQSAECLQARRTLQDVNASLGRGMYDEQARLDQAQRQADLACLSPAAYAESERVRSQRSAAYPSSPYYTPPVVVVPRPTRPQPQPKPAPTNCNVFRCYDAQGNTYPR